MKTKLFFAFLFFIKISFSQEIKTNFITKTHLNAEIFIGVDELENIYYIKNNTLYKKDIREVFVYSNLELGKLTSVNINNPFKIILFYKAYNSIVVLDNKLNELTKPLTYFDKNISLLSYASENNLWIYSKDDNVLQLYDYQNNTINLSTQPLNFYHKDFIANKMISNNDNIWLFNNKGVLHFNQYASFVDFHELKDIRSMYPYKDGFIYEQYNKLVYFTSGIKSSISVNLPKGENTVYINKGKIYIFNNKTLYLYKIL